MSGGRDGWGLRLEDRVLMSQNPLRDGNPLGGRRKGLGGVSSEKNTGKMGIKQESLCLQRSGDETSFRKLASCRDGFS